MTSQTASSLVSQAYQNSRVLTAGKVGTVLVLLERAHLLLLEAKQPSAFLGRSQEKTKNTLIVDTESPGTLIQREKLVKVQNIMAQLQMGLNRRGGQSASAFFELYDFIWEACERGTPRALNNALFATESLLDLIRARFGQDT